MNIKRLSFWVVIFCILLVYVLLFERQDTPKQQKPQDEQVKVFSVTRDDIKGFQMIKQGKKVTILKQGKRWDVPSHPDVQPRQELVESLVSAIVDAVVIEEIAKNPVNLAQYGLDEPEIKVNVILERTPKPIPLSIGNSSPSGVSMYAMIQDEDRVILIGKYLHFSITTFMDRF